MNAHAELKIVFTGPMGAGKTTAIASISDTALVSTDVSNSDLDAYAKESTTVAMDFGQLALAGGTAVRLYGTPGQERFGFMWDILGRGAMGIVLLIDASSPTAIGDLERYASAFQRISPGQPLVVGVGRTEGPTDSAVSCFAAKLAAMGISAPVFSVDVRKPSDTQLLIQTVLAVLEARLPEISHGNA